MTAGPSDRGIGTTQTKILRALLHADGPLPVDALTRHLGISRNATYQHVTALERDGLIEKVALSQTGGRPGHTYRLTAAGRDAFPKHYALFAKLLVPMVKSRLGSADLEACLSELGSSLAGEFAERVKGLEGDRLTAEICRIMLELGYESETAETQDGSGLEIRAHNCVFHDLAEEHNEVCALDIALIEKLAGGPVDHAECMVRGGTCCRFRRKTR